MSNIDQITFELSGNTNFDESHEGELFKRIAEIEEQERAGELIPGLNRTDNILTVAMIAVLGVLPVLWYAVMYF